MEFSVSWTADTGWIAERDPRPSIETVQRSVGQVRPEAEPPSEVRQVLWFRVLRRAESLTQY
jgi:hypothetical protein